MEQQVGDIWHLKSGTYDTHVLLFEPMPHPSYENAYIVFKAIDMNTGNVVNAYFRDMSVWRKVG